MTEIKLTKKEETYLRKKFDKYARFSSGSKSIYFIHVGASIVKSTDTKELFNLLAKAYKKNKEIVIW